MTNTDVEGSLVIIIVGDSYNQTYHVDVHTGGLIYSFHIRIVDECNLSYLIVNHLISFAVDVCILIMFDFHHSFHMQLM